MKIIEIDKDKYKISDNKIFLLKLPNPNEIFINSSFISNIEAQNPDFFRNMILNRQTTRGKEQSILKDYIKFSLNKQYEIKGEKNDCLLFAERVSLNDLKYSKSASVFSVNLGKTNKKFGKSDKDNSEIVSYTRNYSVKRNRLHNFAVNPDIGDAYSMVPYNTPLDTNTCPYHAATVIFKDGDTNITIEADAGIKLDKPIFDMYSVSLFRHSFFINHVKTYLETKVDEQGKILYKVPTVLHLRKTYREPSSKSTATREVKEPTRIQPSRSRKTAGRRKNNTGKKRRTKRRRRTKKRR
tara:strand:+ start:9359 stop:10249 length:891 start_codon:yes stop_codon:yes gene_type:complete